MILYPRQTVLLVAFIQVVSLSIYYSNLQTSLVLFLPFLSLGTILKVFGSSLQSSEAETTVGNDLLVTQTVKMNRMNSVTYVQKKILAI